MDDLGGWLCLPTAAIKNYAVSGAGTLEVRSQINQYLSANKPATNVLLAPWWTGGQGPYQVQGRASLSTGEWEDHGGLSQVPGQWLAAGSDLYRLNRELVAREDITDPRLSHGAGP